MTEVLTSNMPDSHGLCGVVLRAGTGLEDKSVSSDELCRELVLSGGRISLSGFLKLAVTSLTPRHQDIQDIVFEPNVNGQQ
jgi:hypothetical protein